MSRRPTGLLAAAATPIDEKGRIALPKLAQHCRALLDRGCDGINLLGTTGEATSFPVTERVAAMRAVADAGLPVDRFLVGTGAANLPETIELTKAAMGLGYAGALMLPPFYYKGVEQLGVARAVDEVIAGVGDRALRLYLYHYPQMSAVPYEVETVAALKARYPGQLLGVKDSSGDLAYSSRLAAEIDDLDVFPSAEGTIALAKERRFAGCISATLNVNAELSAAAWRDLAGEAGRAALARAVAIREALAAHKLVASIKHALSLHYGDPSWKTLRAPLTELGTAQAAALEERLAALR
jgi:4-hydroxy-tetrahydrodipicolinate synthase